MTLFRASTPPDAQLAPTVEWLARRLVAMRPRIGAVVRAGSLGCCYVLTADLDPGWAHDVHLPFPPAVPVHWVQSYWRPSDPGYAAAVVDPTGAGNAFMGGLMAALDEGKSFDEGESHLVGLVGGRQRGPPTVRSRCSTDFSVCLGQCRRVVRHRAGRPASPCARGWRGGMERPASLGSRSCDPGPLVAVGFCNVCILGLAVCYVVLVEISWGVRMPRGRICHCDV